MVVQPRGTADTSEPEADCRATSFLKIVAPCLIKCLLLLRSLGDGLSLEWGKGIVPIRIRVPSLPLAYPRRTLLMRCLPPELCLGLSSVRPIAAVTAA